jgi:hypothetical protein
MMECNCRIVADTASGQISKTDWAGYYTVFILSGTCYGAGCADPIVDQSGGQIGGQNGLGNCYGDSCNNQGGSTTPPTNQGGSCYGDSCNNQGGSTTPPNQGGNCYGDNCPKNSGSNKPDCILLNGAKYCRVNRVIE